MSEGEKVVVEYVGKLDDGSVFDSTDGRGPLEFVLGSGMVIKGFEDAVSGMGVGEKKDVKLTPDQAYGEYNAELVQDFPKDMAPDEVQEGMTLLAQTEEGQEVPLVVKEVTDDKIKVDLNHPLAGKNLNFEITLKSRA